MRNWAVVGTAPVGSLILGSLAEAWGAPRAILFGAVVCALSAAAALAALPEVRRLESLLPDAIITAAN